MTLMTDTRAALASIPRRLYQEVLHRGLELHVHIPAPRMWTLRVRIRLRARHSRQSRRKAS